MFPTGKFIIFHLVQSPFEKLNDHMETVFTRGLGHMRARSSAQCRGEKTTITIQTWFMPMSGLFLFMKHQTNPPLVAPVKYSSIKIAN